MQNLRVTVELVVFTNITLIPISNVGFHQSQHVYGGFVEFYKDTVVDLAKTK